MTAAELYDATIVKRRRGTKDEMAERARFFVDYAAAHGPVTVRQLYYRAEVLGLPGIDKTESSYAKTQRQVLALRRAGRLDYQHIADATRWMRKSRTYDSVAAALQHTAQFYRKALWRDATDHVEIWVEKDALAGVIFPVTEEYDVALMVARGFCSETFCFEAVEAAKQFDRPYWVYYLGDLDRAGRDAATSLKEKLERFGALNRVLVLFEQIAIEAADVLRFNERDGRALVFLHGVTQPDDLRSLPTRTPKRTSAADCNWPHPYAIELDAIEPDDLRRIVRTAIERHLPADQLRILKIAETSERTLIAGLVDQIPFEREGRG
jgi:hypothetical protein